MSNVVNIYLGGGTGGDISGAGLDQLLADANRGAAASAPPDGAEASGFGGGGTSPDHDIILGPHLRLHYDAATRRWTRIIT